MEELFITLKQLMEDELGQAGTPYSVGKFSGIGWLFPPDGDPWLSLKAYPKTVNIYLFLFFDGKPVASQYTDVFGKSNLGKSCIRIRSLTPAKETALRELLQISKRKFIKKYGLTNKKQKRD